MGNGLSVVINEEMQEKEQGRLPQQRVWVCCKRYNQKSYFIQNRSAQGHLEKETGVWKTTV